MNARLRKMTGVSIIEGLVAVLVLAVGLLALFNFQAGILRSGADARMRTEALQLAGSRLGQLREIASDSLAQDNDRATFYAALESAEGDQAWPPGTESNPQERRFWVSTCIDGTEDHPLVRVRVSWTEAAVQCSADAPTVTQLVDASAEIGLKNLTAGVVLAETKPVGGKVKPPTGEAQYGQGKNVAGLAYGEDQLGDPNAVKGKKLDITRNDEGQIVVAHVRAEDGSYQLLDGAGNILITSRSPLGKVTGSVYVVAEMKIEREYIKVGAPDVSWCVTLPIVQLSDQSGKVVYDQIPYQCYFGLGWYGAIGPIVYEPDPEYEFDPEDSNPTFIRSEFGSNDRVCVGEDGIGDSGVADSRHPQLSYIRAYRGYTPVTDVEGNPIRDAQGNELFASSGIVHTKDGSGYTALFSKSFHDFVLATITGQAADSDCEPNLAAGNGIEQDFFATDLNPPDDGNPGEFYCLTASCPDSLPTDTGTPVTSTLIAISGQFETEGGIPIEVAGATVKANDNSACNVTGAEYRCELSVVGDWTGYIVATLPDGWRFLASSGARKDFDGISTDQVWNFAVESWSAQPRLVSGDVNLVGGVKLFGGMSASPAATCTPTPDPGSNNYIQGDYTCDFDDLPAGAEVTLTVATEKKSDVLCGSINKSVSFVVDDSSPFLKNLCIAKKAGDCNLCP